MPQPATVVLAECSVPPDVRLLLKYTRSLFVFHPPNCVWTTAVPFNSLRVLSKSKVEVRGTFNSVALEKL